MRRSLAVIGCFLALEVAPIAGGVPPDGGVVAREERTFDITFLTSAIPDFPLATRGLYAVLGLRAPDEEGTYEGPGGGSFIYIEEPDAGDTYSLLPMSAARVGSQEAPSWTRIAPAVLVETISRNIAEDSWANSRNSIAVVGQNLVVHQTPDVLAQIDGLLRRLHEQRARMIVLQIAVVPPEALGEIAQRAAPRLSSEEFGKVVAAAGPRGVCTGLTAYNGQRVSAHIGERRAIVTDFDVNQTGVSPVPRLILNQIPLGLLVEARPRTIARDGWVDVGLRVIVRSFRGEPEKHEAPFGEYESVWIAEQYLLTEIIVEEGAAALAGYVEGTAEGIGPFAVLVQASPYAVAPAAAAKEPSADVFATRVYDIEAILRAAGETGDPLSRAPATPDDVITLITHAIEPASWKDKRAELHADAVQLVVCQKPAVHAKIAAQLARWTQATTRMTTIETWDLAGSSTAAAGFLAEVGPGGKLPEDWRARADALGLAVKAHTHTASACGKRAIVSAATSRAFVADWENVAGGTTYMATDYPDPIVRWAGAGMRLTMLARTTPLNAAMVDIEATRAQAAFGRQLVFMAPWRLGRAMSPPSRAGDDEEKPKAPPPREPPADDTMLMVPVPIDLPAEKLWPLRRMAFVDGDTPTLVEATLGKDDGTRIFVVRLTSVAAFK